MNFTVKIVLSRSMKRCFFYRMRVFFLQFVSLEFCVDILLLYYINMVDWIEVRKKERDEFPLVAYRIDDKKKTFLIKSECIFYTWRTQIIFFSFHTLILKLNILATETMQFEKVYKKPSEWNKNTKCVAKLHKWAHFILSLEQVWIRHRLPDLINFKCK